MGKRDKKGILKLDDGQDLQKVFNADKPLSDMPEPSLDGSPEKGRPVDRNGLPLLNPSVTEKSAGTGEKSSDFEALLARSFADSEPRSAAVPEPVPVKKRIKRYPPVQEEIDLHGFTALQAQVRARSFVQTSKLKGLFTVRIVVGRGLHSEMGPVLPDVVADLLAEMKNEGVVLWYEWDRKTKQPSGALIVYLRQFEKYDPV